MSRSSNLFAPTPEQMVTRVRNAAAWLSLADADIEDREHVVRMARAGVFGCRPLPDELRGLLTGREARP